MVPKSLCLIRILELYRSVPGQLVEASRSLPDVERYSVPCRKAAGRPSSGCRRCWWKQRRKRVSSFSLGHAGLDPQSVQASVVVHPVTAAAVVVVLVVVFIIEVV